METTFKQKLSSSQVKQLTEKDTLVKVDWIFVIELITKYKTYFIKKNKLNNKDIYSLDKNGIYYYSGGWHLKAVYSLILGFIFAASTIWNSNLMFLQSYSWIMGAFIAAIVYYLLAKD